MKHKIAVFFIILPVLLSLLLILSDSSITGNVVSENVFSPLCESDDECVSVYHSFILIFALLSVCVSFFVMIILFEKDA